MLQCLHSLTINISCWIKEKSSPEKQNNNLVIMLDFESLYMGRRMENFTINIRDDEFLILQRECKLVHSFYKTRSHNNAQNLWTHNFASKIFFLRYADKCSLQCDLTIREWLNNLWYSYRYNIVKNRFWYENMFMIY